ncbi:MAG: peptidase [Nitrosotalea sp.]
MQLFVIVSIFAVMIGLGFVTIHPASANVWIPDNEFKGFYDINGTYTVIGAVKNTEASAIIPTITINVKDNDKTVSEKYILSTVNSQKDIPFNLKILQVEGKNATLETPQVSFIPTDHNFTDIEIIYDKTLKKHMDGHESGFIVNNDTSTAYGVKIYAAIYGKDGKFLDVGKSVETIDKIDPGQKIAFSMHPDPQHASMVSYYSCFTVGDDPTMPVSVIKDGKPYNFIYLTTGSVTDTKFDDATHSVIATVRYPFPDSGFVNFMFPQETGKEKFSVTSDGKPVEFVQSKDLDGYWHVALTLPPRSTSYLSISGFDQPDLSILDNFGNYILIIIPIAAIAISITIWKKKKD